LAFWSFDIVSDFVLRTSDFEPKKAFFNIKLRCRIKPPILLSWPFVTAVEKGWPFIKTTGAYPD
jgi:hypothetical protein